MRRLGAFPGKRCADSVSGGGAEDQAGRGQQVLDAEALGVVVGAGLEGEEVGGDLQ
jgi:hypothetical protein